MMPLVQKEKGVQRRKRQEEILKAEKLGVEGPKRKIPRVRQCLGPCCVAFIILL